jgi:periplasmic protein TonB
MFDQVVNRRPASKLRSVLVVGSALAHGLVVAAVAVGAMWHIDKLPLGPDTDPVVLNFPKPPAGAGSLPEGARLKPKDPPKDPIKTKVKDTVQPVPPPTEPVIAPPIGDPVADVGTGAGAGGDGPPGDGPPCDGPACADLPPCADPPCATDGDPPKEQPKPEPVVRVDPPVLPPNVAKGLRIDGDDQIRPTRDVQLGMLNAGQETVRGTFRLCVDAGGAVSSVKRLGSTGYDAYDADLMRGMQSWRYRPYMVDGQPAPMCTVVVFSYRIKA